MSYRRDNRASRTALFDNLDGIEEGGLRASSSYSRDIDEHENEKSLNSLQDRVVFLKRLTGDIHEEVQSHNRMLDRMGNGMDSARGILSGTMDRFKMVFEKKSSRRTCKLVTYFVLSFFIIYYLFRCLVICHFLSKSWHHFFQKLRNYRKLKGIQVPHVLYVWLKVHIQEPASNNM